MSNAMSKPLHVLILLAVALALASTYAAAIVVPFAAERAERHAQIIEGTADSPYRYRVLVPFAVEAVTSVRGGDRDGVYVVFDFLAFALLLWGLYVYCGTWYSPDIALIGALLVGATLPVAFRHHAFQPWSLLEPGLMVLGLILIQRDRRVLLALVVGLAALNRETGLFVALAFPLANLIGPTASRDGPTRRQAILWSVAYLAIWGACFVGLRLLRGGAPSAENPADLLPLNVSRLAYALLQILMFAGILLLLTWTGFARAPRFARHMLWLALPYLLTVVVWGIWYEVRLLMPLYPLLLPVGLAALAPPRTK